MPIIPSLPATRISALCRHAAETREGYTIGTLCAIDRKPRDFSERDERILEEIAGAVMDRIELLQFAATDGLTNAMTRRASAPRPKGW